MENVKVTSIEQSIQPESTELKCKTPPSDQKIGTRTLNSGNDSNKYCSPRPLKVPKAFKYPERYRSPTDLMVSPVTRGLLARNRKGGILLPPSLNQPKVRDMQLEDVVSFKIET